MIGTRQSQFLYSNVSHELANVSIALKVGASDHALIYIIACPTGPYFKGSRCISLCAAHDTVRAWPGGTGGHKLGLNYSPTFGATKAALARGYQQVLFLFGDDHRVTEAGAMNFFVVLRRTDGQGLDVVTPLLDGTILPGITRASVLALVASHSAESPLPGLDPSVKLHGEERVLTMGELHERATKGELLEAFCVGTAVVVASVNRIGYQNEDIALPEDAPVADALFEKIEAIQEGRIEWEGWSVKCE